MTSQIIWDQFKAEKEKEGRGEKQKETPQAAQTLLEFVRLYKRMYENTQYIRPKFPFLAKRKMTHLVFLFCYLLSLCF